MAMDHGTQQTITDLLIYREVMQAPHEPRRSCLDDLQPPDAPQKSRRRVLKHVTHQFPNFLSPRGFRFGRSPPATVPPEALAAVAGASWRSVRRRGLGFTVTVRRGCGVGEGMGRKALG